MDATTGFSSPASTISRQIRSEAMAPPPGLLMRTMIASMSSSSRAARTARISVAAPATPCPLAPWAIAPVTYTTAMEGPPSSPSDDGSTRP